MRDYEKLVENLRSVKDDWQTVEERWMLDAANAIEELSKPKWISVEERLPDGGVHVLACCRARWLAGSGNLYVCDAFHSSPKTIVCSYDDDIDSEYDEETDEYYFPEGWWEVIKNWDDYSCVAIEDTVTHWMPLPEPPKEEQP